MRKDDSEADLGGKLRIIRQYNIQIELFCILIPYIPTFHC
jgi:hypothetical protein